MKRTTKHKSVQNQSSTLHNPKLPFIEHVYELRKRLFYVTLSIGLWATGAYFVQHRIVAMLLAPAHNQEFIYTTVGGGIDFLLRVCLYAGIVCSIPIIVFQLLKYLQPLVKKDAVRFMAWGSVMSGVLAILGMTFGYFFGLPAALHFLLHQFSSEHIEALLSINSYMSFVTAYMFGSAFIFQLPLLLILINRIKPLQPKKLLGMERWVILISFILGGILSPSPRVQDQVLLAGPIILTYQIGVGIVWLTNRRRTPSNKLVGLRAQDEAARAERLARFEAAQAALASIKPVSPATVAIARPVRITPSPIQRRNYVDTTTRRAPIRAQAISQAPLNAEA
jgi:sec-independent protein translocase protein TatC